MPANHHLRGHVLPGGDVRDVYVIDGHITFEAPAGGAETIVDGGWITPGLVDAHAHLPLSSPAGDDAPEDQRIHASAAVHLDVGVLLVHEPGAPSRGSAAFPDEPTLPRIVSAGQFIAPPGRYVPGFARPTDPADLERAVSEEAAASGAWVKLIGDWFEPGGRIEPNWSTADLRRAVTTAHAAGTRVAIHATCTEAIADTVDAGVDSIEHGTGMSIDMLSAMAAQGTAFTPTMSIIPALRRFLEALEPDSYAAVMRQLDDQPQLVAAAARAGVTLLAGTDAAMVPHGVVAGEIGRMLAAGVAPDVAVGAGSWAAREYLGYPCIEEGAPADIVVFADDPRLDAANLDRRVLVMRHGAVHRRVTDCVTCELMVRRDAGAAPVWDAIMRTPGWDLTHALDSAIEGWLVLVLRRHVTALADLSTAEAEELGPLIRSVSQALHAVTGCDKTYVAQFAEHPQHRHVHVHVVACPLDLADDLRGPGVFACLGVAEADRVTEARMNEIALEVRRHLSID